VPDAGGCGTNSNLDAKMSEDFHPEYADMYARAICYDLREAVERIQVVGGLRRKQPRVKGVSIIYISKVAQEVKEDVSQHQGDLFGGFEKSRPVKTKNVYLVEKKLPEIDYLSYRADENGDLITQVKHPFRFKAMICLPKSVEGPGLPVDLFPVQTDMEWGVALTLKTGPARYAMRMESAARRQGYRCDGHRLFKISDESWTPVLTEEDFFRLCHVSYVPPEER
jgi:DNA polymerase/3'-5' exonuclease PolX